MARNGGFGPTMPGCGTKDYVGHEKARLKHWANPPINPHGSVNHILHQQHGGRGPVYAPKGAPQNPVHDGRRGGPSSFFRGMK